MIADTGLQALIDRLIVPNQDLAQLSFCGGSKDSHVNTWVHNLPMTRINFVSGLLYQAVPEIGRLKASADTRLAILESLRPSVQQCIQGLSRQFLNQPLILPDPARKTATVAQALQKHMSNAYLVAVRDLCLSGKQINNDSQSRQALAIHRALSGLGLQLLRSYQLYTPIAGQLWVEIHTLYQIASLLNLIELPVWEPLPHHQHANTIHHAYLRLLLLACAKPNQMRQDEVLATYYALENLSPLAQLQHHNPEQRDNLFAVMLDSNRAPVYKSRLSFEDFKGNVRELNTSQLAKYLREQASQPATAADENSNLRNALNLSPALTDHLVNAWNILAQRSFERQDISGTIEVAVGLSNLHFHICDQQPFSVFLNQTKTFGDGNAEKIFQKRGIQLKPSKSTEEEDPWGDVMDLGDIGNVGLPTFNIESAMRKKEQQDYQGSHPTHKVPLLDASPGGYCLEWQDEIPNLVRAGELVGLREEGRQKWGVGVIRWIQQAKNTTLLGIQVLAPQATPLGVAIVHKNGGFSEYLRALQLPALKAINQPATLITNAVSFGEYNKVRVFRPPEGETQQSETTIQLNRRVFSTGAFSQFSFREIASMKPDSNVKDDFDAVWQKK